MSDPQAHRAVRIELATSDLEGGCFRAWADPVQVLAVLAFGSSRGVFPEAVEPQLRALAEFDPPTGVAATETPGAPPLVGRVVRALHALHSRLYQENRSRPNEPRWAELFCAMAEEDRVYFLKGAPAFACLLRANRAFPVGGGDEPQAGDDARLGRAERLGLALTSVAVRPGDTLVALLADPETSPDPQAVRNLFAQTPDLKRACDGLVNLLGLQSQGACAVAFRFVPVGVASGVPIPGVNFLEELAAEMGPLPLSSPPPSGSAHGPEGAWLDDWAKECSTEVEAWSRGETAPSEEPSARPRAPSLTGSGEPLREAPRFDDSAREERSHGELPGEDSPYREPPPEEAVEKERRRDPPSRRGRFGPNSPGETEPEALGPSRSWRKYWPSLVGAVVLGLVLFAGIPGRDGSGGGLLRGILPGASDRAHLGSLEVAPDPPARAVLLNGSIVADGTPARIDSIPAGRQKVALDLGPCGLWETEVEIRAGTNARVAPLLTGSIEVVAEEPVGGGRAWLQGRAKRAIPTVLDSVPVGWNRVFYEDDQVPLWDRLVLVKADRSARVVVPNRRRSDSGRLRVEALLYQEREGLVESTGDSIWVDGRPEGRTPRELTLRPGLHSVRVGSSTTGYAAEVLDLKAGSLRYLQAQLGRGEVPALRHVAPGRVLVRGPLLLSVAISGGAGSSWTRPTLHLPEMGPGLREVPMTPVEGSERVFVGLVRPENLPLGRDLTYYFTVTGPDGQTVWSDLFRLRPESPSTLSDGTPPSGEETDTGD